MPNITVQNLTSALIIVPGGYYVGTIAPLGSVTFVVPDSDVYSQDARVLRLVNNGTIRLEYDSADVQDRPMPIYTTATLPAAGAVTAGTMVWNSTTKTVNITDGTNWDEVATGSSVTLMAAATAIPANRFVGLNGSALVVVSPAAGERPLGVVPNSVALSTDCRVQMGGAIEVMTSSDVAADDELIAAPGGFAAPFQAAAVSLGTAVAGGTSTQDDLEQGNLPDQVRAVCAATETASMIIYGDVGGAYTKETVALGGPGIFTSTNTFAAIYCIAITAESVGTIDVEDAGATAGIIPAQIAGTTAARRYGSIVPDVATDSEGQHVQVVVGGANASDCVVWGTDYAGAEQAEIVTMAGTAAVESTLAYRSFDEMFIGADGEAWNAGATSQYTMDVGANERNEIRAYALEAEAVAGATVQAFLLPQNQGRDVGHSPVPYHVSQISTGAGAGPITTTVYGVLATDVILATVNASTNPCYIVSALRSAADTVQITYSADPGASTTIALTVWRV